MTIFSRLVYYPLEDLYVGSRNATRIIVVWKSEYFNSWLSFQKIGLSTPPESRLVYQYNFLKKIATDCPYYQSIPEIDRQAVGVIKKNLSRQRQTGRVRRVKSFRRLSPRGLGKIAIAHTKWCFSFKFGKRTGKKCAAATDKSTLRSCRCFICLSF